MKRFTAIPVLAFSTLFGLAACGPDADERAAVAAAAEADANAVATVAIDSIDTVLADGPRLTRTQQGDLREYLNAEQVATAQEFGVGAVRDSAEIHRLVANDRLVALEDSSEYWVVRDLTHSMPYVTPDAHAMLTELGRRFHARLDSLGLPAFRFEISSALRTGAMQADLRQGNSNASRTTSSHEFGTTVDVAYNEFSAPAELPFDLAISDTLGLSDSERAAVEERVRDQALRSLGDVAHERAPALQAILGEALLAMQGGGHVQPLIERSQPVYHMTVARWYDGVGESTARVAEE